MKTDLFRATRFAPVLEYVCPVVYDVGARGGLDEDFAAGAWTTTMVGFEPDPGEADRLKESSDKRWREVHIAPIALGPSSGRTWLHLPASPVGASLLPHNLELVERFGHETLHRTLRSVQVETKTLDEAVGAFDVPPPDYLKLDIEGAELGVLQAGPAALAACAAIKVECAFLEQRLRQPLAHEVIAFLHDQGFALAEIRDMLAWRRRPIQAHPRRVRHPVPYSRGLLAQADLVFLRTPESLIDDTAALRAVVTAAVLGFIDYGVGIVRRRTSSGAVAGGPEALERALLSASRALGVQIAWASVAASSREFVRSLRCALNLMPADRSDLPY